MVTRLGLFIRSGLCWLLLCFASCTAWAQGGPFNCDITFYQVRSGGTDSVLLKFPSVSATVTPTAVYSGSGIQPQSLNAIGYNPVDNYIYGLSFINGGGPATLVRVGTTGYVTVGVINNISGSTLLSPTFIATGGVFDAGGRYYFAGQGNGFNAISPPAIFRIDTIPLSGALTVAHQYNLTGNLVNVGDFDFNGAGGPAGLLLGATSTTFAQITLQPNNANPALGIAQLVTSTFASSGNVGSVGSAFYDAFTGKFYTYDNGALTFSEITNPTGAPGTQAVIPTVVPAYGGTPATSPTGSDGTSCPLSGVRRADLSITKTDGVTSVPIGGNTAYVVTMANAGPFPGNYAVIRDPVAAGLIKTSVTCTPISGPPFAVCPATLSIANLESAGGQEIVVFPPNSTLQFTINATVTGAVGSLATNTATISAGPDFIDPNLSNNAAVDVNLVTPATVVVISGPQQCPAGTTPSLVNLVNNGTFSTGTFNTAASVGGLNSYTAVGPATNFVSIQSGAQSYAGGGVLQNPFPGDAARNVSGGPTWLLSNGKSSAPTYNVWQQTVGSLTVGRSYQYLAYMSNATRPNTASPTVPNLELQINGATFGGVGATFAAPRSSNETGSDTWTLVQGVFNATTTSANLSIANVNTTSGAAETGDLAAITQVNLRVCLPNIDVSVVKTNPQTTLTSGANTTYTLVIRNTNATVTATNVLINDPPVANIAKVSATCVASVNSVCPPPGATLPILTFESPGVVAPLIAPNGVLTITLVASVTGAPGSTATNGVNISSTDYADTNLVNNQSTVTGVITGSANMQITKSNGGTALVAGSTTGYTITVSNLGPSTVVGAVMKDAAVPGLLCTSVTCSGTVGAASCPLAASVTIAALQGTGITLPSMVPPSSISFFLTCGVTATGL